MNKTIPSLCCALAAFESLGLAPVPAAAGGRLASEVRAVFMAKCAGCHGPNLAKPKGRFGYVHDLARVAGNREMVVPSFPDESELWELVRFGEMPPEESPAGPLSNAEKEIIYAWIAAGAPTGSDASEAADRPASTSVSPPHSLLKNPLCVWLSLGAFVVATAWHFVRIRFRVLDHFAQKK